jgi:hypothetical protein
MKIQGENQELGQLEILYLPINIIIKLAAPLIQIKNNQRQADQNLMSSLALSC